MDILARILLLITVMVMKHTVVVKVWSEVRQWGRGDSSEVLLCCAVTKNVDTQ